MNASTGWAVFGAEREILDTHGEILAAVEARRPGEARLAMATHIDYARDRMLRLFATDS